MHIVLVGGSGFLGTYLVREFVAQGHHCTVLTRQAVRRRHVAVRAGVRLVEANVHDPAVLAAHFEGAGAVVSMAGILNPSGRDNSFRRVHVGLVESIVDACRSRGVRRLLHISALNAGNGKSRYLETKGRAEQVVRSATDLRSTIFQPSVIFGAGDSFFNRFGALLRLTPVLPLACAGARMQPVFAADVAAAVSGALEDESSHERTYELGGPGTYTLGELVRFTATTLGMRRLVIGQPDAISMVQGAVMGFLPNAPFSLDNFRSLQTDNVCEHNALPSLGISPASIEAVVPDYLGPNRRQRSLAAIRRRARRSD